MKIDCFLQDWNVTVVVEIVLSSVQTSMTRFTIFNECRAEQSQGYAQTRTLHEETTISFCGRLRLLLRSCNQGSRFIKSQIMN